MNKYLLGLLVSNSFFVFAGSLFVPLYAVFVKEIGGGAIIAGALYGTHFLSSTIADIFVVRMLDKKNFGESVLKLNYLVRGLCWLALGMFQRIEVLFLVQILIGISEAFGNPAFNSLISENLDGGKHISEWGWWELLKNPVIAGASFLSGVIVTVYGFKALFLIMSVVCFLSFGLYLVFLRSFKKPAAV